MFSLPNYRSYPHLLRNCVQHGDVTASRVGGMDSSDVGRTKEFRDLTFELTPGDAFKRPGYNPRLAWVETLHLLAGSFDPEHFRAVAPKVGPGMFTPQMAYGPRVQPHLARVVTELRDNPHSRRAIVFVSDNAAWPPPCTNSVQFLVRNGRLETTVSMRSWDLWLGLPYDTYMFGALALAVSGALGRYPVGRLRVQAASAHLYEKHWEKAGAAVRDEVAYNDPGHFDLSCRGWTLDGRVETYFENLRLVAERDLARCPWPDGYTTRPANLILSGRGA